MNTTDSDGGLFQEAARAFRDSLSPSDSQEFMEFSSATEMIQELNKRVSNYRDKSKLVGFCQRLERISESLSPFFDVIGIFIQSNPEVPALVWGALRMVFLLASNFSNFLEKLLGMFEKIGDRLPGYAGYHKRLLNRREKENANLNIPKFEGTRLLKVLSYIYEDYIKFCQEACKIFVTKRRGIQHKAAVVTDIFWKPFDVRFKNILERIDNHHALFDREMHLEEARFTEIQLSMLQHDSENAAADIAEIKQGVSDTKQGVSDTKQGVFELRRTILGRAPTATIQFESISRVFEPAPREREQTRHRDDFGHQNMSPIFDTTFRQIAKWINASDFSRELNKAQEARLDDTGKWFLASPCYKEFKSLETRPVERGTEPPETQIMFIQGKSFQNFD